MEFPNNAYLKKKQIPPVIVDCAELKCENSNRMAKTKTDIKLTSNGTPDPRWRENLANRVIGQQDSINAITPYLDVYFAGLNPMNRPAGIFLLLGSTGSGKTHTAEALAASLHGSTTQLLRIDCGEYQSEHEIAKLIGSPPGYLGHRETRPVINSERLAALRSDKCGLAIVVFDEIEKGAESLKRILLSVMDKGVLNTGVNELVKLEHTILIFTSNLGSNDIRKSLKGSFSFEGRTGTGTYSKALVVAQAKKHFSAEFINRIDEILPYNVLNPKDCQVIVERIFAEIQGLLDVRLNNASPILHLSTAARKWFVEKGYDTEYGARSLKRLMAREIQHPIALALSSGDIGPNDEVWLKVNKTDEIEFSIGDRQ